MVDGEDEALVYSAALDRRRNVDAEKLVAARLDVGEVLAEDLYPRVHSVVFTSATIAAGDSFDHFARGVGLDRLVTGGWRSLKLASSYDFERQMAVFVPLGLERTELAALPRRPRAAARSGPPRDGRQRADALHEPARHGATARGPGAAARARGTRA